MKLKLNQTDYKILESLAEYRIVTVKQISAIFQTNRTATSKRMKAFKKAGFVETRKGQLGRSRGRPEELLYLAEKGFDVLKNCDMINPSLPYDAVAAEAIHCPNHQLLTNWFRIHLAQIQRVLPRWSHSIFTYSSPFLPPGPEMGSVLTEYVSSSNTKGEMMKFIPDAVIASRDTQTGRSLLFFLEVDMGTETLARPDRSPGDVREKIINYQTYFRTQKYKRYEQIWGSQFKGFRLLFLTQPSQLTG